MMFVPVREDILTYTAVITGRHRVVILKVHNRRQTSTQHFTVKTAGQLLQLWFSRGFDEFPEYFWSYSFLLFPAAPPISTHAVCHSEFPICEL